MSTQVLSQSASGTAIQPARKLLEVMALKFNVDPDKLMGILKSTVIKSSKENPVSDNEVAAFLIIANQYDLNPFLREIHAFADSTKGIVPIVGIDGWSSLVNRRPEFNGAEFEERFDKDGKFVGTTCRMHLKTRDHPMVITEWIAETKRNTAPWNQMPRRMNRHKAFMQCARLAFSISGIYDEDEARDIVAEARTVGSVVDNGRARTDALVDRIKEHQGASALPAPPADNNQTPVPANHVEESPADEEPAAETASGNTLFEPPQIASAAVREEVKTLLHQVIKSEGSRAGFLKRITGGQFDSIEEIEDEAFLVKIKAALLERQGAITAAKSGPGRFE